MKKTRRNLVLFSVLAVIVVGMVFAGCATAPVGQAGKGTKGSTFKDEGYKSQIWPARATGFHYNLNIHGKKANFNCQKEPGGGSIFVPENGQGIQILIESGRKGGSMSSVTELQVVDPCAGFDGDAAMFRLPPGEHFVVARALAKPTNKPSMTIVPALAYVIDEQGNDLLLLGLVTDNGFVTPEETFTRAKGKSRAIDITGMFEWSGDVCYFDSSYCEPLDECTLRDDICCIDLTGDGIYDDCTYMPDDLRCPEGYTALTLWCKTYTEEWVFNIADLVGVMWGIDNNGLKLLQLRFYPESEVTY